MPYLYFIFQESCAELNEETKPSHVFVTRVIKQNEVARSLQLHETLSRWHSSAMLAQLGYVWVFRSCAWQLYYNSRMLIVLRIHGDLCSNIHDCNCRRCICFCFFFLDLLRKLDLFTFFGVKVSTQLGLLERANLNICRSRRKIGRT